MPFPPPDKRVPYPEDEDTLAEDLEAMGVEGEVIEVEPIEIEGRTPYSQGPGGKELRSPEPDWIGREEEPLSWRIAEFLEPLYGNMDNGSLRVNLGKGFDEPGEPVTTFNPDAALTGLTDVVTFGHADELGGAARAALRGEDYGEARDSIRERTRRVQEENPGSTAIGAGLGVAASAPMLARALPAAAETGGWRIGQALGEGTILGALGAEGASEAELGSDEHLEDIAEGAAYGGAFGGAFGALGEGARVVAPAVRRWAARQRTNQVAGSNLADDLGRIGRTHEEAVETLDRGGVFDGVIPRRQGTLRGRTADMGEEASRRLEDIAENLDGGVADVGKALRRARQAIERGESGAGALDPWIGRLLDGSDSEIDNIGRRLAGLAGSGAEGLAERQALRAARTGEPVGFGTLEAWRRQIADELLSNPSAPLQRLHDDLAEALLGVAESRGVGPEYFEALQAQQLAQIIGARGERRGIGNTLRGALTGSLADGAMALHGAANAAAQGLSTAADVSTGGVGTALGIIGAQPGARYQGGRALGAALEGAAPALSAAPRNLSNVVGQAVPDASNSEPEPTASLADLDNEAPTASLEDLEDDNPEVPTASLSDL